MCGLVAWPSLPAAATAPCTPYPSPISLPSSLRLPPVFPTVPTPALPAQANTGFLCPTRNNSLPTLLPLPSLLFTPTSLPTPVLRPFPSTFSLPVPCPCPSLPTVYLVPPLPFQSLAPLPSTCPSSPSPHQTPFPLALSFLSATMEILGS